MTCPACHYTNDDEARFCEQCGHALEISCPACGGRAQSQCSLLPQVWPATDTVSHRLSASRSC